ncbi:oligosaccharide flippase family protein [Polynucleobacter paneuropaeus]|uniref:Oligosaccharide flippase family protein n=1 Tax=Polynucleobacter paneuropaeus TaxID=2527775 RepID=A0AAE3CI61_9BURK|nr:oligosaccharide flippase family protein [Polynucleobacter paneuropaeus]MBT8591823.1 oligosaccharide flippase family protein [Polynucleobacter paneuropaeus]MBT8597214.1 oligosaccharide flippase family protein [Polynucleobacter paneuropaeus]MBT8599027.1 oligosaccharide flippase family protein [Polynucleobacter paneuropaeus]
MRSIKLSLTTNFLSQIWGALIGFLFIPVYVRILGIESYGIIGFFVTLQAWFILLDLGLTPALSREMSRYLGGAYSAQAIRNLLRSLELICLAIALIILVSIFTASHFFGYQWFKAGQLAAQSIQNSLGIIAILVALRYLEGFYRAALIGLQLQVWCNLWNIFLAALRNIGVIGVLIWISSTLEAYFIWHTLVSVLAVGLYVYKLNDELPQAPAKAQFSVMAVKGIWKFAGGMVAINFISMMLTQMDKLLLSKLLDLKIYGYYILAATLAGICYMVVGPITSGFFPFMVEKSTRDDHQTLTTYYHQGSQLVAAATTPVALILLFFAQPAIYMWSGNLELAQNAAPILSVLVIGCYLNSLMWMPYQFQLANGITKIILFGNLIATFIFVPGIYFLLPLHGVIGIAWLWGFINCGFILIIIPVMHQILLKGEMWKWYLQDTLMPFLGALIVVLVAYFTQPHLQVNRFLWFFYLSGVGLLAIIASVAASNLLRKYSIQLIRGALR